jgi:hypothetical protein
MVARVGAGIDTECENYPALYCMSNSPKRPAKATLRPGLWSVRPLAERRRNLRQLCCHPFACRSVPEGRIALRLSPALAKSLLSIFNMLRSQLSGLRLRRVLSFDAAWNAGPVPVTANSLVSKEERI